MRRRDAVLLLLNATAATTAINAQQPLDPLKPLIVMINGDTQGAGIVFRLDENRRAWILTAYHVVAEKKSLTVRFFRTDDAVPATLFSEASEKDDLAVLTVPAPAGFTFPFHLVAPMGKVGDAVRALGNPAGEAWTQTHSNSTISRIGSANIQIESPVITNGYSGGALVDAQGRLLGMVLNTGGATANALRLDRAREILRSDLGLTVNLGGPAITAPKVQPPKPPGGLTAGTPRTNSKDGLVYRWIPPGEFLMGCSPGDEECDTNEARPPKRTDIPRGFWIGETEVTQAAYQKVTGANPSKFKGPQLPVEQVDWNEASDYCQAVGLRLPSEAEWEYAARAGSTAARYGHLADVAHIDSSTTGDVGKKAPNAWGLRDTLGNVWEWTADWYERDKTRVVRGGSWFDDPMDVRVSYRSLSPPWARLYYHGFRCAGDLR